MIVATDPVQSNEKVTAIYPPRWLSNVVGSTAARLIVFLVIACKERPDIVGGFHLLFNGLAASFIGALAGARSMYVCVGGPMEIADGGLWAENRLFNRLGAPSPRIERALASTVRGFDIVITMGSRAAAFIRACGTSAELHIIPGGFDPSLYCPHHHQSLRDLIFVGRLAPVKRIDLLLEAVAIVKRQRPDVSLAIVGEGVLRSDLERKADDLGIRPNVMFVGHRNDVAQWLATSRLFVLVSDTEGVSLSLIEALACGVPAIVSDVGDLADAVQDGANGYLLRDRTPEVIAASILKLLRDEPMRERFAASALESSRRYAREQITRKWDEVFGARSASLQPARDFRSDAQPGMPIP